MWKHLLPLVLVAACTRVAGAAGEVMYSRDVAPILYKHCAACHRPGEVGPFSLLTYKDAARRARHLKSVTASRRMPPWHAESGPFGFLDERRLSEAELRTLARWAETGAKEGDPKDLPPLPNFTEGWQLGQPDLVVKMPRPFSVPADAPVIRVFAVPIPVDQLKWIKGLEFRPGNRKVVHHANLFLDPNPPHGSERFMRRYAEKEKGLFPRLGVDPPALRAFPGLIGAWTPGHTQRLLPEEIAYPLRPKTDLVLQIHYQPTGKPETDQSSVGLYFSERPGRKYAAPLPLSVSPPFKNAHLLDIPAGRKRHKVELSGQVPADTYVYAAFTHAHYLLREMELTATPPGGKPFKLLRIPSWDFNWQDRYVFAKPPKFPRGTRLHLTAYFDNSADNPQNPNNPPRDVHWGELTTDEMFHCVLVLLPAREVTLPPGGFVIPPDARILRQKYDRNGDGRLSQEEMAELPSRIRLKVESLIEESARAKPATPEKAEAAAEKSGPLRLPPGGFPLPANARLLRDKYDTDRDGKLSQKELEAIPQPLRRLVEDRIRQRLGELESTQGEERLPVRTTDPPGLRSGRSGPPGGLPASQQTGKPAR